MELINHRGMFHLVFGVFGPTPIANEADELSRGRAENQGRRAGRGHALARADRPEKRISKKLVPTGEQSALPSNLVSRIEKLTERHGAEQSDFRAVNASLVGRRARKKAFGRASLHIRSVRALARNLR